MMSITTSRRLTAAAIAAVAAVTLLPTAAQAAVTSQDAGFFGGCRDLQVTLRTGSGWCDGNGPDWTYRGVVICSNGNRYRGVERWAGDRRRSTASCPGSATATRGGVEYYYLGRKEGAALRTR